MRPVVGVITTAGVVGTMVGVAVAYFVLESGGDDEFESPGCS